MTKNKDRVLTDREKIALHFKNSIRVWNVLNNLEATLNKKGFWFIIDYNNEFWVFLRFYVKREDDK